MCFVGRRRQITDSTTLNENIRQLIIRRKEIASKSFSSSKVLNDDVRGQSPPTCTCTGCCVAQTQTQQLVKSQNETTPDPIPDSQCCDKCVNSATKRANDSFKSPVTPQNRESHDESSNEPRSRSWTQPWTTGFEARAAENEAPSHCVNLVDELKSHIVSVVYRELLSKRSDDDSCCTAVQLSGRTWQRGGECKLFLKRNIWLLIYGYTATTVLLLIMVS